LSKKKKKNTFSLREENKKMVELKFPPKLLGSARAEGPITDTSENKLFIVKIVLPNFGVLRFS
jgi:hypothetical protein